MRFFILSQLKILVLVVVLAISHTSDAQTEKLPDFSVNVATFCDSATDVGGKLSIKGTFDTVSTERFPMTLPKCSLAIRVAFARRQFKKHELSISFLDVTGKPFREGLTVPWSVKPVAEAMLMVTQNLVINLSGLQFPKAGTYLIQLSLNGKPISTIPFCLVKD